MTIFLRNIDFDSLRDGLRATNATSLVMSDIAVLLEADNGEAVMIYPSRARKFQQPVEGVIPPAEQESVPPSQPASPLSKQNSRTSPLPTPPPAECGFSSGQQDMLAARDELHRQAQSQGAGLGTQSPQSSDLSAVDTETQTQLQQIAAQLEAFAQRLSHIERAVVAALTPQRENERLIGDVRASFASPQHSTHHADEVMKQIKQKQYEKSLQALPKPLAIMTNEEFYEFTQGRSQSPLAVKESK